MLYIFQYKLLNINKIKKELQNVILQNVELKKSGWQDSNLRPPAPKAGAITGLRYTPKRSAEHKVHQFKKNLTSGEEGIRTPGTRKDTTP